MPSGKSMECCGPALQCMVQVSDHETKVAKQDGRQAAAGMARKLKQKEQAYLALHQEYHAVLESNNQLQAQCSMQPPFSEVCLQA